MRTNSLFLLLSVTCSVNCWFFAEEESKNEKEKKGEAESVLHNVATTSPNQDDLPTVLIVVLVRNKAHALPYFFGCLENLTYPKEKISFFIRSDHNADNSIDMLKEWTSRVGSMYNDLNIVLDEEKTVYEGEDVIKDWVEERFQHIINLREDALNHARKKNLDFIFYVDADNLILEVDALQLLMKYEKVVIAPMLTTTTYKTSRGKYSNWWGDVTEDGYEYKPTPDSDDIYNRQKIGLFKVGSVHCTFLMDLRAAESSLLSFQPNPEVYSGPLDDVVIFNFIARYHGVDIWLSNEHEFGYVPKPFHPPNNLEAESYRLLRVQMVHLLSHPPMGTSSFISPVAKPAKTKLGMDRIYVISLPHRENRRRSLRHVFDEWGIEAEFFDAVDGKRLTADDVHKYKLQKCRDYRHYEIGRDLTYGEVGCFLSHYSVWKDALEKGYERIMIMEDDAAFEMNFRRDLKTFVADLEQFPEWDLLYLARYKVNQNRPEPPVKNTKNLVYPSFNTWALNYVLSRSGIKKLINSEPQSKLLPVDLLLPILYNRYFDDKVNRHFEPRNLIAFATKSPVCFPVQYHVDKYHVSDTDNGDLIPEDFIKDNDLFSKEEL